MVEDLRDDAKSNPEQRDDAKSNPKTTGRRKVCPSAVDDAKSVRHPYVAQVPTKSKFEDTECISRPMDLENTLSKGQPPATRTEITRTKNLPYRKGIGPHTSTPKWTTIVINAITPKFLEEPPQVSLDKSRGEGGVSWVNPRKQRANATTERLEDPGGTRVNAPKRDLRGLEGMENISLVSIDEKGHLPTFQHARGAPRHAKEGYRPMVDGRTVPWINPREQHLSTISTKANEDAVASTYDRAARSTHFGKCSHHHSEQQIGIVSSLRNYRPCQQTVRQRNRRRAN